MNNIQYNHRESTTMLVLYNIVLLHCNSYYYYNRNMSRGYIVNYN